MNHSKEYFLTALDIYSPENLVYPSILIKSNDDDCPFALLTEKNGHVVLSVGDCLYNRNAIVVTLPYDY